ncbi:MAG: helix-hairpin-helix domain-containing protein [Saprospiraceae bacterium]
MIKKDFAKTGKVCKTTFNLPKEAVVDAKNVVIVGEFNNWNLDAPTQMKKKKDGSFETTINLESGRGYEFRYLIDNVKWENDWNADDYVPVPAFGVFNSLVVIDEKIAEVPVPAPKKAATAKAATKKTATPKAEKAPVAKAEKVVAKKAPVKKAPAKKAAPKATATKTTADDLTKIEGVGPKIAGLMKEAGIVTFDQLAKAKAEVLKEVLNNAGPRFKMHDPSTWTEQATLAAKGDFDTLKKLQDELKGGKRK